VTVNNKDNFEDFCLDSAQEFGLGCSPGSGHIGLK
jgi:hypothetical protein